MFDALGTIIAQTSLAGSNVAHHVCAALLTREYRRRTRDLRREIEFCLELSFSPRVFAARSIVLQNYVGTAVTNGVQTDGVKPFA